MARVIIDTLTAGFLVTTPRRQVDGNIIEEAFAEPTLASTLQRASRCLGREPAEAYLPAQHHAVEAPMPPPVFTDDDEPPLRACANGACGMD